MRVVFEGTHMHIRTRCRTIEQLVGTLKHCVEGSSLFISTLAIKPIGTEVPFAIGLADYSVVMRGRGVIREAWSTTDNRFQRPGILVGVRALTRNSMAVFDQIRARPSSDIPLRIERPFEKPAPVMVETTGVIECGLADHTQIGPPQPTPRAPAPHAPRRVTPPVLPRHGKITIPPRVARPALVIAPHPTDVANIARAATEQVSPSIAIGRTALTTIPAIPPVRPVESRKTRSEKKTLVEAAVPTVPAESFTGPTHVIPSPAGTTPVLPANPLATLSDDALAGYVDCTMFQSGDAHVVTPAAAEPVHSPSSRRRRRAVLGCALVAAAAIAGLGAWRARSTDAGVPRPTATRIPIQLTPNGSAATVEVGNHISIDVVVRPHE